VVAVESTKAPPPLGGAPAPGNSEAIRFQAVTLPSINRAIRGFSERDVKLGWAAVLGACWQFGVVLDALIPDDTTSSKTKSGG